MMFPGMRINEIKDGVYTIKRSASCTFADLSITIQIDPTRFWSGIHDQDLLKRIYEEGVFDIADILNRLSFELVKAEIANNKNSH